MTGVLFTPVFDHHGGENYPLTWMPAPLTFLSSELGS
jgi:hypothetical protein